MVLSAAEERNAFITRLDEQLAVDPTGIAVVRLDLDRFLRIGQIFGRAVSDVVRAELVRRLQALATGAHWVLELTEEAFLFVVSVEEISVEALEHLGMSIISSVSAPIRLEGVAEAIAVGSNTGLAFCGPATHPSASRLLAAAELAIQEADSLGSRRSVVYRVDPDDPTRIPDLFADMLGAIERHEFHAFLQPVISVGDGRLVGAETLVRWMHPHHGVLYPRDFVAEAERSGLIRDIDGLVWQSAWSWFAEHAVGTQLTLSVNLSPADLDHPGLTDKVAEFCRSTGLAPKQLVFEVTETALTQNWELARRRLAALRELGCRIAVDDFGSGYMFLERLATDLFDIMKIDRSLIVTAESTAPRGTELLRGVVALGKQLGMTVLAEGIETEQQLQMVRDAGCDFAQGFHLGRPMPTDDFAIFMKR